MHIFFCYFYFFGLYWWVRFVNVTVFTASLIRGNRSNCALFCDNLDWLVSKLDRLEASSGIYKTFLQHTVNKCHKMTNSPSLNLASYFLLSYFFLICGSPGILEVLYCVLIESPEVLNIIQENHIKSIISLLDKHGRNHKVWLQTWFSNTNIYHFATHWRSHCPLPLSGQVLDVLRSLCVCNGVAVRSNQNLITENLLPGRDLLLQTNIVNYVSR